MTINNTRIKHITEDLLTEAAKYYIIIMSTMPPDKIHFSKVFCDYIHYVVYFSDVEICTLEMSIEEAIRTYALEDQRQYIEDNIIDYINVEDE